jgi:acyl transferase domain-containing protein
MQLGQAGPAGFFNSSISSAVQHMTQGPQDLPGIDAKTPLLPPQYSRIATGRREACSFFSRRARTPFWRAHAPALDSACGGVSYARPTLKEALMATAFVFPGQGSQSVGMGKALADAFPSAKEIFARIDAALGQNLSKIIFEGPDADLTLTANAQPALMAVSLAATRALQTEAGLDFARDAKFVAGHSLGEYSALAAVEAIGV